MHPRELLVRAAETPYGIAIAVPGEAALRLRRLLYGEREKARREGLRDFDRLSFLLRRGGVWIVRRGALPDQLADPQCRPLGADEVPRHIGARGPAGWPLWGILQHLGKFPDSGRGGN